MSAIAEPLTPRAHRLSRAGMASLFSLHGIGRRTNVAGFGEMMRLSYRLAASVTFAELAAGAEILLGGPRNGLITRPSSRPGVR